MFDAEAWLGSLDPIGWRFGLDRIKRLLAELGEPQHRYATAHIVGTNGKSAVAAMTAALAEAHGIRTGAYISPHTERWSERVRIGGEEIPAAPFSSASGLVREAIGTIAAALPDGETITQFEAVTATAFVALATSGVELGVIEAGLGGRLDATNVLRSNVTALTSIDLEHTQWLGDTVEEIAAEKLAVLGEGSVLVTGALEPAVAALAERTAHERGAQLIVAAEPGAEIELASPAPYLRRDFAVAIATAKVLIGELDPGRVRAVAGSLDLPGRVELIGGDPPAVLDAAHNPAGALALAEALPAIAGDRPVLACVAVLADKDAPGIVRALAPALAGVVCTELPPERLAGSGRPGAEWHSAAALAGLFRAGGIDQAIAIPDADSAWKRALESARAQGGIALAAGSHYLLTQAWTERHAQSSSR